jgi:hypothetical protein
VRVTLAALVAVAACASAPAAPVANRATTTTEPTAVELVPPPGFVRGANLDWMLGEPAPGRVDAWSYEVDAVLAQLELAVVDDHPDALDRWAYWLARGRAGAELAEADVHHEFNYHATWIDAEGRRNAEWGWVAKGGERVETYDRFIAHDARVWHVRLAINGHAPAELARWLHVAFDLPFRSPGPDARRSLAGEYSPR